jgi:hypothetical protein
MPAIGADLAVVIDTGIGTGIAAGLGRPCLFARARHTVRGDPCRGIGGEFGIEGARPFRVHARQIKTFLRPLYTENPPFKLHFPEEKGNLAHRCEGYI